jgi:beta-lactamase superfamily II metal-dependent hydrolase
LKRATSDDKALVLQFAYGARRVLLMSDSGFTTEHWLLENEPDLRSDIVIKGHHAKDLSGTAEFLSRVAPQVVVCTSPGFSAPREALDVWEQNVRARGINVFPQSRTGAVHIVGRADSFEVRSFIGDQTFRSRAR